MLILMLFLMHRVELKDIFRGLCFSIVDYRFLMHRVELKVKSFDKVKDYLLQFLKHRVELKVIFEFLKNRVKFCS